MPRVASDSRSRTCSSSGPAAPVVLSEPTSSWSNRAMTDGRVAGRLGRAGDRVDGGPARDLVVEPPGGEQRLGRRRAPPAACDRTGTAPTRRRRRRRRRRQAAGQPARRTRRRAAHPMPHTGVRCCCLSSTRPRSLTSRSRWMASCGTRQIASSTRDVDGRAVAQHDAAGDAEVAVEPRVDQRAAVDLDAELLPTDAAGVGPRLDAQARRVGVGADEPQR